MIARNKTIGIDTAKATLELWESSTRDRLEIRNTDKGMNDLKKYILKVVPDFITIEATNIYHRRVVRLCESLEMPCIVAQPKRVRNFAQSMGVLAKNDSIDARITGLYGLKSDIEPTKPLSKEHEALRDLVVLRMQLAEDRGRQQTRKTEATSATARKVCDKIIAVINKEIEELNRKIVTAIADDLLLAPRFKLLKTIKGIGDVTAAVLVMLMPELGTLTKEQVASLAGLAPFDNQSGKRNASRSIYGGRTRVRAALYMAVQSAVRWDPYFKSVYSRLLQRGKKKRVAHTACMRKLIIIANQMIISNTPYNPDIPLSLQSRVIHKR